VKPFGELVTIIDDVQYAARPADTLGPTEALYRAHCRICRTEYPGSWRLATFPQRPARTPPAPPIRQEMLW
jgi:hypothetical protein